MTRSSPAGTARRKAAAAIGKDQAAIMSLPASKGVSRGQ